MKRRSDYAIRPWRSDYFPVLRVASFVASAIDAGVRQDNVVVDVGSGESPWRAAVEGHGARYVACDYSRQSADVVCAADALPFRSGLADVVLCTEVLEHVGNWEGAVAELSRILRPGGLLIATTPFLIRLHEAPHDYQRPTLFGLERALTHHDFAEVTVTKLGNETEVIATVIDGTLLAMRPEGTAARLAWGAFRGSVRLAANGFALASGALVGERLPRAAYLGNGILARRG